MGVDSVVGFLVIILLLAFCIVMIPVSVNRRKRILKAVGAERSVSLIHVHGLPAVGSTLCNVFLKPDSVMMEDTLTKQIFEVPITRVFKVDREVVRKGNFSLGKAVVGDVLAGPIGAFLAGSSGNTKQLLIIGYATENGDENEVAFASNSGERTNALINFVNAARAKISRIRSASAGTVTQL